MGFLDGLTGWGQGVYNCLVNIVTGKLSGGSSGNHNYTDEEDTEEDNTTTQQYKTVVMYGEPLRPSKFIFVPEMNDFYTDDQLNTLYHSADDYRNAVKKYGFIYKTQKFDNADTAEKLLEYSKDWIKNNYHGGIISFTITALDMRLLGRSDLQKYTTGRRVAVKYKDPSTKESISKTLTVITAEYDLLNPDKNQYKIGIPDVTLNKVYGETSKSGGGGGGGNKTSDETDEETNTELDGLEDVTDEMERILDHKTWAHILTGLNSSDEGGFQLSDLLTPREKDPTSDYTFAMAADAFKSTILEGTKSTFSRYFGDYVTVKNGVDTDTLSSNKSNTGRTNATSIDVVGKTTTKELEASDSTTTKDLDVTGSAKLKTLSINGTSFRAYTSGGKVKLVIGGTTYTITPD